MILKLTKCLNDEQQFTLVSFDMNDKLYNQNPDLFNDNNIYTTDEHYYYYIKDICDLGDCQKFKIKAKKGDIVTLTSIDNSFIVFPSKRTFAIAFDFNYNDVLKYKWKEVLLNGKPYEVKYVKNNEEKVNNGVVYTLSQLVNYVSIIIKGHNYHKLVNRKYDGEPQIKRIINKYYSIKRNETDRKYELNMKQVFQDKDGIWRKKIIRNISESNKFLYDYWLLRMFAYMILSKSVNDKKNNNEEKYCFSRSFDTVDEVYDFLEDHQEIVNNFFIESELLFNKPNDVYIAYGPHINGIYMYTEYLGVKYTLYRSIDERYANEKTLKQTYVTTFYKHKIKGIKTNWNMFYEKINDMI